MKTLKISDPIVGYSGGPLTDDVGNTIYFKNIFIQLLGPFLQPRGTVDVEKVILAHKIGQKLFDCNDEYIELEDAEFKVLKEAAESLASTQRWSTLVLAPVYERLKELESTKE